ncbi:MAG: DNA topoisomerase III, partial [Paramuribaculum sp.]|nr:DNA topoisomerase III [Paramuribaculum sp.]
DEAIREGFKHLKPQSDYDNLYYAGLSRAIGDWILGLNATRLYSLKYSPGGGVLSIGRVQTPTLALIVKRFKDITEFKPEDYWELKTVYRDTVFNATEGKFKSEEQAQKAIGEILSHPLVITDIKQKSGKEAPPRLFDLTSLQVECNKRWGWTADETLRLIQTLYEKKVTTYPRVDTTYLSDDIYNKVPDILKKMTPYANYTAQLLAGKLPKSKKVFDSSKVTDHHAIIPTGESPSTLAGNERKMYHLIAMRFIAAFYPDCHFETTTVEAKVENVGFKTSGKVITSPGWRSVLTPEQDDTKGADEEATLPVFTVGESGAHTPALQKKTTQPPKHYTEGTLLRAMESAGKLVDDETLREALKENGIGRPSTRAAIIETLFKRNYLKRERKNILPTQAGIDLIATIKDRLLKSAELTGIWENKLRRIERGDFSAGEFVNELKEMINSIVVEVLSDNSSARIEITSAPEKTATKNASSEKKPRKPAVKSLEAIECPLCGKGHLLKGKQAYGCSRFRDGCSLRLPFEEYPADVTPAALVKLIKKNFKK